MKGVVAISCAVNEKAGIEYSFSARKLAASVEAASSVILFILFSEISFISLSALKKRRWPQLKLH